jgi:hypothetical protein
VHYITQPVPIQQPHRNHGLFSDHYLNETLPQRSDWLELAAEAKPVMDELKRVFERYGPVRGEKEARTEKYWVRPVLEALGHAAFEERPSLKFRAILRSRTTSSTIAKAHGTRGPD